MNCLSQGKEFNTAFPCTMTSWWSEEVKTKTDVIYMYMVKSDKIKNKSNMFARVNEVMLLMSWRHQNVMLNFFHISLLLSVNIMHFLTLEVM